MSAPTPEPPLRPREPLVLDDGRTIGSIEPALGFAMREAKLPVTGVSIAGRPCWQVAVDALESIAQWLHANRHGGRWRAEQLAVTDEAGAVVGTIERAVVRPLGIATHAVHLVGRDPSGRIWVQQRALDKATDPGLWDTLMGGLMSAGETVATTLERETWEEAGLRLDALEQIASFGRFTVRRPVSDGYMVEHIEMYGAVVPGGLEPNNQDGEVAAFECLPTEALRERLRAGMFTYEAGLILDRWLAFSAA